MISKIKNNDSMRYPEMTVKFDDSISYHIWNRMLINFLNIVEEGRAFLTLIPSEYSEDFSNLLNDIESFSERYAVDDLPF